MTGDVCIRCGIPIEENDPSYDAEMYTMDLSDEGIRHQLEDQVCVNCANYYNRQKRPKKRTTSMEEYITRSEFEQYKRHMEQKTEEMKAIRVDVHNVDVEAIKQELHTVSDVWLQTLQEHYSEHKEALSDVKTVQSGHSKFFEEHGKRLAATATKDDLTAMQGQIKQDTGTIETRLDRIETRFDKLESTQEQILKLLQQKSGE